MNIKVKAVIWDWATYGTIRRLGNFLFWWKINFLFPHFMQVSEQLYIQEKKNLRNFSVPIWLSIFVTVDASYHFIYRDSSIVGRRKRQRQDLDWTAGSQKGPGAAAAAGSLSVVLAPRVPPVLCRSCCVECKSVIKRYVFSSVTRLLMASRRLHLVLTWKKTATLEKKLSVGDWLRDGASACLKDLQKSSFVDLIFALHT